MFSDCIRPGVLCRMGSELCRGSHEYVPLRPSGERRTLPTSAWGLTNNDPLVFCLPFLVLYRLQLKRGVKISVYCVFLLGVINLAFSLTRFLQIQLAVGPSSFRSFTLIGKSMLWIYSALSCWQRLSYLPPLLSHYLRPSGQHSSCLIAC